MTHYTSPDAATVISGDWRDWLESAGYNRPPDWDDNTPTLVLTESKNKDDWAFYHPPIGNLDTEYICVGIPTEEAAENLLEIAAQMIDGPLSMMLAVQSALKIKCPSA